jgi:hypothetical protein
MYFSEAGGSTADIIYRKKSCPTDKETGRKPPPGHDVTGKPAKDHYKKPQVDTTIASSSSY